MDLLQLLDSAHPYLSCFDYDHYPDCFREFETDADAFFRSLDAAAFAETADGILDRIEARWKSVPRLKRSAAAGKDRSVMALFFTPAAARHSETARAFADVLRERWNSRFPRFRYLAGDYDAIMKGFDTDFLGITLRKSKKRS